MKYTIIIVCSLASVAFARPDLYKENEDFQYSRSSPNEGQKSGFYAAQRGNMGGNYEKAKNMDSQANRQMSDLVHQVGSQLGVDPALLHGDGSRLSTHGNLYGSATVSGTTYGQSSLADQKTGSFQTLAHNTDARSLHHDTYVGYDRENRAQQARGSAYDQYGSNNNYAGNAERNYDTSERRRENVRTESGYDSADRADFSGSSYKSSVDSQRAVDSSYHMGTDLQNIHQQSLARPNIVYLGTPVRLAVRPGQVNQINIPVTAQNTESYQENQFVHSSNAEQAEYATNNRQFDSSDVRKHNTAYSGHERVADTGNTYSTYNERDRNVQKGTSDIGQNYKYSYRKDWEKHSATPDAVRPVAIPLSIHTVPVRQQGTTHVNNIDEGAVDNSHLQYNYQAMQNEQKSRYIGNADSRYKSDTAVSQSSNIENLRASDFERDTDVYSAHRSGSDNIDFVTSAPKSYQSAYSYHKSWERQGTPYVIKPAGSNGNLDSGLDESKYLQSAASLNNYNSQKTSSAYSAQNAGSQRSSAETRHSANFQHNMKNMHSNLDRQLTDSMDTLCNTNCGSGSSSKGYKASYTYNAERSYGAGEADENGHYRYVRSTKDRPKRYSSYNRRGDIAENYDHVQDVGQQQEDVGQQVENFSYAEQDIGLETPTLGQQQDHSDYQKLLQQNKQILALQPSTYSHSYENADISGKIQPPLAPGHTHKFYYGNFGSTEPKEENIQKEASHQSSYTHSYSSSSGTVGSGLEKQTDQVLSLDEITRGETPTLGQELVDSDYQKLLQQKKQSSPSHHNTYPHSYETSHISGKIQPLAPGHTHEFHYGNFGIEEPKEENRQKGASHQSSYTHSYSSSSGTVRSDLEKQTDRVLSRDEIPKGEHTHTYNTDTSKYELETPSYGFHDYNRYPDQTQVTHTSHSTSPTLHDYHRSYTPFQDLDSSNPNFHNHHSSYPTSHSYHTQHDWSQHSGNHQEVNTEFDKEMDEIMKQLEETAKSIENNNSSVALSTQNTQQRTGVTGHNNHSSFGAHGTHTYNTVPSNTLSDLYNNNEQIESKNTEFFDVHDTVVQQTYDKPKAPQEVNEKHHVYYPHRDKTPSEIESLSLVTSDTNSKFMKKTVNKQDQKFTNTDDISLTLQPPYRSADNHPNSNNQKSADVFDSSHHLNGIESSQEDRQNSGIVLTENSDMDDQAENEEKTGTIDINKKPGADFPKTYSTNQNIVSLHSYTTYRKSTKDSDINGFTFFGPYTTEKYSQVIHSNQDIESLSHTSDKKEKKNEDLDQTQLSVIDTSYGLQDEFESNSHATNSEKSTGDVNKNHKESHLDKNLEGLHYTSYVSSSNYRSNNDQQIENVNYTRYNAHAYPSRDHSDQNIGEFGETTLNYGYQNKGLEPQKSIQENVNGAAHNQQNKQQSETFTENQESDDDNQQIEDLGQQTLNFNQQEDWGQQSVNLDQVVDWGQTEDFGQQVEDIGQQSQDLGQQVEDIGQQSQDLGQQVEEIGQQSQDLVQQVEDLKQQVEEDGQVEVSAQYGDSSSVQTNYRSLQRENMDKNQKLDKQLPKETPINVDSTTEAGFWKRAKDKASSWFG